MQSRASQRLSTSIFAVFPWRLIDGDAQLVKADSSRDATRSPGLIIRLPAPWLVGLKRLIMDHCCIEAANLTCTDPHCHHHLNAKGCQREHPSHLGAAPIAVARSMALIAVANAPYLLYFALGKHSITVLEKLPWPIQLTRCGVAGGILNYNPTCVLLYQLV